MEHSIGKTLRCALEQHKNQISIENINFSILSSFSVKSVNNRKFRMEFREDRRKKAFEENLEKIREHNELFKRGKYSFKLSPNNLADLTPQSTLR